MKYSYLLLLAFLFSSNIFTNNDPWKNINENTQIFNEAFDDIIATPLARSYMFITPDIIEHGITNFIFNVEDVSIGLNNILQGNLTSGLSDLSRVIINTSLGLGGFLDVASSLGLEKHDEDFGQTLAVWGVPSGPYLVLPGLGPSTLRDTLGMIPDSFVSPTLALDDDKTSYTYTLIDVVDTRSRYIGFDNLIIGNKYLFFKDAYLQKREFEIKNGLVEDSFDSFDSFDEPN